MNKVVTRKKYAFYKYCYLLVCFLFPVISYANEELPTKIKTRDNATLTVSSRCVDYNTIDLEKQQNEPPCTIVIQAFRGQKMVASYQYKTYTDDNLYLNHVEAPSLKGVVDLVELTAGGNSCGTYADYPYFAWTGKEILLFAKLDGVPDGAYSSGAMAVFNDDPEFSDIVTIVNYAGSVDSNGIAYQIYKTQIYQWDGVKLSSLTTI